MKIRPSILCLATAALVLVALVIWLGRSKPAATMLPTEIEPTAAPTPAESAKIEPKQRAATSPAQAVSPATTSSTAPTSATPLGMSKEETMLNVLSNFNHMPIVYYGKLEDQFGSPVPDAGVDFSVRVNSGYASTTQRGRVESDANGFFTISGYTGADLSLNPQKPGYALASTNTWANYSLLSQEPERIHPDPSNPIVIKMWKLQGAEHLISFDIRTNIPIDGTPIAFDLETGQRVKSGGDMLIHIESSLEPNIRDQYNWRLTLRAINGGIIECSRMGFEKMFQAPDTGYQPEFTLGYQQGTRPWAATFSGGFYFTSRNGQCYGKCSLQVSTYRVANGAVPITLRGFLNPAGSRNLEINPILVTQAHP